MTAVVNTGDDTVVHGLSISPDLDTITYTLAGAIDPERGWGLAGETWGAMDALERFADVRPPARAPATTWFSLGDRDLATHLYRTARLAEGARPTEVADEIRRAWGVGVRLLPMTDDARRHVVELASGEEVASRTTSSGSVTRSPVRAVRFAAAPAPRPTAEVLDVLGRPTSIVIAPSNPIVSIGLSAPSPGVDERAGRPTGSVVGGVADRRRRGPQGTRGPTAGRARPRTVRRRRRQVVRADRGTLVIDPADADLAPDVEAAGMRALVVPSVMTDAATAGRSPRPPWPPPASGRSAPGSPRGPRSRGVHGDHPRWIRARTGETAKRVSSSTGGATYSGGGPAGASSAHRSRSDVCTPVPTFTTSPLPRRPDRTRASTTSSTNTKSRVCRPSPAMRSASPPAAVATAAATTPPSGRWRGPYTLATARAVNSMPHRSR